MNALPKKPSLAQQLMRKRKRRASELSRPTDAETTRANRDDAGTVAQELATDHSRAALAMEAESTPKEASPTDTSVPNASSNVDSWACPLCTLNNPRRCRFCSVCKTRRPAADSSVWSPSPHKRAKTAASSSSTKRASTSSKATKTSAEKVSVKKSAASHLKPAPPLKATPPIAHKEAPKAKTITTTLHLPGDQRVKSTTATNNDLIGNTNHPTGKTPSASLERPSTAGDLLRWTLGELESLQERQWNRQERIQATRACIQKQKLALVAQEAELARWQDEEAQESAQLDKLLHALRCYQTNDHEESGKSDDGQLARKPKAANPVNHDTPQDNHATSSPSSPSPTMDMSPAKKSTAESNDAASKSPVMSPPAKNASPLGSPDEESIDFAAPTPRAPSAPRNSTESPPASASSKPSSIRVNRQSSATRSSARLAHKQRKSDSGNADLSQLSFDGSTQTVDPYEHGRPRRSSPASQSTKDVRRVTMEHPDSAAAKDDDQEEKEASAAAKDDDQEEKEASEAGLAEETPAANLFSKHVAKPKPLATSTNQRPAGSGWISNRADRAFMRELDMAPAPPPRSQAATGAPSEPWHKARPRQRPRKSTSLSDDDSEPDYAYQETVRCRSKRQGLPCHDCYNCRRFYEVLRRNAGTQEANDSFQFSRHRAMHSPSETPVDFWELDFIDERDQK